jgi:hypothetical protein
VQVCVGRCVGVCKCRGVCRCAGVCLYTGNRDTIHEIDIDARNRTQEKKPRQKIRHFTSFLIILKPYSKLF